MRTNNIKASFTMKFPYGKPDKNGVCYSREAVLKALSTVDGFMKIDDVPNMGKARMIGMTQGAPYAIQDIPEEQAIQFTVDGVIMFGGTECIINHREDDGTVTDFEIVALGVSE